MPSNGERSQGTNGLVAVAIDNDKSSQSAIKWATDHLLQKGQTVILIHVKLKPFSLLTPQSNQVSDGNGDLPLIHSKSVVLEATDIAKALIEYVTQASIEVLVIGASTKTGFLRFIATDIPGIVSKGAPDFCNVYVISKGKISSMRSALRPATNSCGVDKKPQHDEEEEPRKSSDSMESFGLHFLFREQEDFLLPGLFRSARVSAVRTSGRQVKELLEMQLEVQRHLCAQLEIQQNQQQAIEEQGKQIKMMVELLKETNKAG